MSELSNESIFGGAEFVFTEITKDDGKKEIVGGGYKLESFLLEGGMSPMTSYNTKNQSGGKVSSPLESLAVPAGLFYINMRVPKKKSVKDNEKEHEHYFQEHKMLSDDVFDKLFNLVEVDKKRQRKTRKGVSLKHSKAKTRKHK
jgi:hypothetical protein